MTKAKPKAAAAAEAPQLKRIDKKQKRKKNNRRRLKLKQKQRQEKKKTAVQCDSVEKCGPTEAEAAAAAAAAELDMSMWESMGVCPEIVAALRRMGFAEPTAIQREAIPAALRDRRNVLGAAETGSGKTLAFGIPVIQRIMAMKAEAKANADDEGEGEAEGECVDDDADQSPDEDELAEFGWADGEVDEDLGLLAGSLTELGPDGAQVDRQELRFCAANAGPGVLGDGGGRGGGPLYCLVLTPTRELAKQVAAHLERAAALTGVTVAAVLGGLSAQRQERLLAARPDIVVGTPGRLWDLVQAGQPHLAGGLPALPMLVLDEADRLAEPGHFAEMRALLERLNSGARPEAAAAAAARRQTLLFSATLTFARRPPDRATAAAAAATAGGGRRRLKQMRQLGPDERAAALAELVGMAGKPKLVDTTRQLAGLTESRLDCEAKDKDLYLWWLLGSRRGRTLVFCASKDTVRRLHRLLSLLRCPCHPLHSDMPQRQRLKSLDRFSGNADAILLATDVAARGLDIPGVEHVMHYQVPKVSELYLHRCGRTARASRSGTAVALVSPEEAAPLRRLLRGLATDRADLAPLTPPPAPDELARLRPAMSAAKALETEEHRLLRQHAKRLWFERTAEELELEPDLPELLDRREGDEGVEASHHLARLDGEARRRLEAAKRRLGGVLDGLGESLRASAASGATFKAAASAAASLPVSLRYPTLCSAITTSRGTEFLQGGGGGGDSKRRRRSRP